MLEAALQGEAGGDLSPTASLGFGNLFEKTEADVSDIRVSLGLCSGVYAPAGAHPPHPHPHPHPRPLALESRKPASLACRQFACPQAVFDYRVILLTVPP